MGGRGSSSRSDGGGDSAASAKMPELQGSEKQVAWANSIRRDALKGADNAVREAEAFDRGASAKMGLPTTASTKEARAEFVGAISQQTSAKAFIDRRGRLSEQTVESHIIDRARGIDAQKKRRR